MSNRTARTLIRWTWRLLIALICLLGLLWLLQTFLLPSIVRGQIESQLRALGFTDPRLTVEQVSLTSATLRNVRADDALDARLVHVTYTPSQLLAGRVDDILIEDLTLRPARFPTTASQTASAPSTRTTPPFSSVQVTGAQVNLPTPSGEDVALPVEISATEQERNIHLRIRADYAGIHLDATTVLPPAFDSAQFTVALAGPADPLLALVPEASAYSPENPRFTLKATGDFATAPALTWKLTDADVELLADTVDVPGGQVLQPAARLQFQAAGDANTISAALFPTSRITAAEVRPAGEYRSFGLLIKPRLTRVSVTNSDWLLKTEGLDFHAGDFHIQVDPGQVSTRDGRLVGELSSTLDLSTAGQSELLRSFLPQLAGVELGGRARLTFSRAAGQAPDQPGYMLQIADATLASQEYQLTASGIEAQIVLTDLANLTTPPGQVLKVAYGQMGKWEVVNGLFQFQMKGPTSIDVEKTELGWAAGRLWTDPYHLNLASPIVQTSVHGRELDLGKVAWVLSGEKAWGVGLVDLDLPVTLSWPKMRFGEGYVQARPGGLLNLDYVAEQVGAYLVKSDPRFVTDPTYARIRERVVTALRNFRFSRLRADMKRSGGQLDTLLQIQGKGDEAKGQELNLNLNVADLDWLISRYLALPK